MNACKLLFIAITSVHLTACMSTPFEMFSDEENSSQSITKVNGPYGYSDSKSVHVNNQKIMQYVQELEEIRPQLTRILAMEQDLSFMIEQMTSFNNVNNEVHFIPDGNEVHPKQDEYSDEEDKLSSELGTQVDLVRFNEPSLLSQATTNNNLKVLAAPSLSKFSGLTANLSTNPVTDRLNVRPNKPVVSDVDNSKFSQSPAMNKASDLVAPVSAGIDQSGIHLVSVSKKSNLSDFWNVISKKFPDILASKQPLVELVNVNGKQFYSLRVGPFSNKLAKTNCQKLAADGTYCGVVNYHGEPLKL